MSIAIVFDCIINVRRFGMIKIVKDKLNFRIVVFLCALIFLRVESSFRMQWTASTIKWQVKLLNSYRWRNLTRSTIVVFTASLG